MNKGKQIEQLEKDIRLNRQIVPNPNEDEYRQLARLLIEDGYRKVTDVAREIFEEIEHTAKSALILLKFERDEDIRTIKSECYEDLLGYIAELKKKWEVEE